MPAYTKRAGQIFFFLFLLGGGGQNSSLNINNSGCNISRIWIGNFTVMDKIIRYYLRELRAIFLA